MVHCRIVDWIRRSFYASVVIALCEPSHSREVIEERPCARHIRQRQLAQTESAMQKATRPGRVYDKFSSYSNGLVAALPFELHTVAAIQKTAQCNLIEIAGAETLRLLKEEAIEVGAIPMGVCDPIMRTRSHQQLILPVHARCR